MKINKTDFINWIICIAILVTHKIDFYWFNKEAVISECVLEFWLNSFVWSWLVWLSPTKGNLLSLTLHFTRSGRKCITQTKASIICKSNWKQSKLNEINGMNQPMLLPDRLPKMLPLNGGFRYPASVSCVTVSKMPMVIKIIKDVTDRVANNILTFVCFFFFFFSFIKITLYKLELFGIQNCCTFLLFFLLSDELSKRKKKPSLDPLYRDSCW